MEMDGSSLKSPRSSTPAAAVTVTRRSKDSPRPCGRSTTRCSPSATVAETGVFPLAIPSISTSAGGLEATTSLPPVGAADTDVEGVGNVVVLVDGGTTDVVAPTLPEIGGAAVETATDAGTEELPVGGAGPVGGPRVMKKTATPAARSTITTHSGAVAPVRRGISV